MTSAAPLTDRQAIDMLWVIVASGMVFFMQLGFLCLEIGLVQAKNAIDTAVKNVADFVVTSLVFLAVGFGFMFGHNQAGLIGSSDFFLTGDGSSVTFLGTAFIFLQLCFAGCAVTIIAGGTAERSDLTTHLLISIVIAAVIYPIFGHWVWGNLYHTDSGGWLSNIGFIDFAGSSVVHGVGGWVTLAGIMALGPRRGRYGADGKINPLGGNNIPMAALGTFILWFGWFGFNGGSLLKVSGDVGAVILKTNFAAAAGGLTSYFYARWRQPKGGLQALPTLAGTLGGMVAITAGSFAVPLWASLIIGALAGIMVNVAQEVMDRFQLDDPAGAVPVHAACGALGTILTGVFATQDAIQVHSGSRLEQIGVQILGSVACFVWSFGIGWLAFRLINKIHPIRVSAEEEERGLNITEYDDVMSWLDYRKTQQYETTVDTLNQLVDQRTKALKAEHDQLDTVLNSMGDALIVTGLDGTIALTNPAFSRMTQPIGVSAGDSLALVQSLGRPLDQVLNQSTLHHVINQAITSVGDTFSSRFDWNGRHYQASARSIENNSVTSGVVTVIRDISGEVQGEKSRLDFVSNVSHELRTPLTSVVGFARMIRHLFTEELRPGLNAPGVETADVLDTIGLDLDILMEESERLTRLINDVLDLSRMDAQSLKWEIVRINPQAVINQTVALFTAMAAEHQLDLIVEAPDAPIAIMADQDRLQQVLTNLVSNAIKFTEHGSILIRLQVTISDQPIVMWEHAYCPDRSAAPWEAFTSGKSGQWMLLSVTDSGIGIQADKLPVIFERFGQVGDPLTNKPAGTGLGLAICLDIVRYLNGFLWVESEVDHGSKFVIALKVA